MIAHQQGTKAKRCMCSEQESLINCEDHKHRFGNTECEALAPETKENVAIINFANLAVPSQSDVDYIPAKLAPFLICLSDPGSEPQEPGGEGRAECLWRSEECPRYRTVQVPGSPQDLGTEGERLLPRAIGICCQAAWKQGGLGAADKVAGPTGCSGCPGSSVLLQFCGGLPHCITDCMCAHSLTLACNLSGGRFRSGAGCGISGISAASRLGRGTREGAAGPAGVSRGACESAPTCALSWAEGPWR